MVAVSTRPLSLADRATLKRQRKLNTNIPKVALLGHSMQNFSHADNVISTVGSQWDVRSAGLAAWLTLLCGGRVEFPLMMNFGVSSSKSTDMTQTRLMDFPAGGGVGLDSIFPPVLAAYGTLTPVQAAIASGADMAILWPETNDRTNAYTLKQSLDAVATARDQLIAAGLLVIVMIDPPRGDTTNTSKRLATGGALETHFLYAQELRKWRVPGCWVADPWPYLASPASTTGDAIAGMLGDGLHPGPAGAYWAALPAANIINTLYPPVKLLPSSNSDLWSVYNPNGNLMANPMLTGTGGTKTTSGITPTGNVADSWEVTESSATGGTIACSKIAASSDGLTPELQRLTIGGTWTSSGGTIQFRQKINGSTNAAAFAGLAPHDILQMVGGVTVSANQVGLAGVYANVLVLDTGGTTIYQARGMVYTTIAGASLPGGYSGIQRTDSLLELPAGLTLPNGNQVNEIRVGYEVRMLQNVAVSGLTIDLWPVSFRKAQDFALDWDDATEPYMINDATTTFSGQTWVAQNASTTTADAPWSIKKSPHTNVYRFEIRNGDHWAGDGSAKNRSELSVSGFKEAYATDYYAAWSFRHTCPGWNGTDSLRAIIGQLHPAGAYLPVWDLEVQPTGLLALKRAFDVSAGLDTVTQDTQWTSSASVVDDAWHSAVLHWKTTALTTTGTLELWLDGVAVFSSTNIQLGFLNDTAGPYLKFGDYRNTNTATLVTEYANIEYGTTSLAARVTFPLPVPTDT